MLFCGTCLRRQQHAVWLRASGWRAATSARGVVDTRYTRRLPGRCGTTRTGDERRSAPWQVIKWTIAASTALLGLPCRSCGVAALQWLIVAARAGCSRFATSRRRWNVVVLEARVCAIERATGRSGNRWPCLLWEGWLVGPLVPVLAVQTSVCLKGGCCQARVGTRAKKLDSAKQGLRRFYGSSSTKTVHRGRGLVLNLPKMMLRRRFESSGRGLRGSVSGRFVESLKREQSTCRRIEGLQHATFQVHLMRRERTLYKGLNPTSELWCGFEQKHTWPATVNYEGSFTQQGGLHLHYLRLGWCVWKSGRVPVPLLWGNRPVSTPSPKRLVSGSHTLKKVRARWRREGESEI